MVKPLTILNQALNKKVLVSLRGGKECVGTLDGYDQYMNLILKGAEERKEGETPRKAELILLRGDNIVFISP
jgi:small nuclear ribonucleoprotein